jgi:hypothetical protein
VEYLDLDDFYNREYVLRSETFRKHSAHTLRFVSAAVRCTDTFLSTFPHLDTLILHGQESFPTLYPAVFANLENLKHLTLVNYKNDYITEEVPLEILSRLETLTIRPAINTKAYALHKDVFPLKLKRLYLDGGFDDLQSVNYCPHPCFSLPMLLAAAEEILIEARIASTNRRQWTISLPQRPLEGVYWAVEEILNAPKTFKQ